MLASCKKCWVKTRFYKRKKSQLEIERLNEQKKKIPKLSLDETKRKESIKEKSVETLNTSNVFHSLL